MANLGSRPVLRETTVTHVSVEPVEEDEGDPAAEARLDEALASLRSGNDILASLDQIKSLVGEEAWSGLRGKHEQLRNAAGRSKAEIAREGLADHLRWIDSSSLSDVERAQAMLHAFSSRIDDLDPVQDREAIDAGHKMFAIVNPPETQDET